MGASYTAIAVIGVEVEAISLYDNVKVRSCTCDIALLDARKYCPECGKSVWIQGRRFKSFCWGKYLEDEQSLSEVETICGFPVTTRYYD